MKLIWVPDDYEINLKWLLPKLTPLVHSLDAFFSKPTEDGLKELIKEMSYATSYLDEMVTTFARLERDANGK